MPAPRDTGLTSFVVDMLRDATLRRQARHDPKWAAAEYGLSPETVGFYLKMMGEK